MKDLKIEKIKIDEIKEYENNSKIHTSEQIQKIKYSISKFGYLQPILIDENNMILAGHGRYRALKELKYKEIPVIRHEHLTDTEKTAFSIADNSITMMTGFDEDLLKFQLNELEIDGFDTDLLALDELDLFGDYDEKMEEKYSDGVIGSLARDLIIAPVNIFDTRKEKWLERKRVWRELINDNGETRQETNVITNINDNFETVSLLDPVLAEIICYWFTPQKDNNKIFDCFAGDTIFGYVAGKLGNEFTGIELRKKQADLNNERTKDFNCKYICDDGQNVDKYIEKETQDLFFSCPPYFDLEVYSDMENDASNQKSYEDFYKILDNALRKGVERLKENRFAVIVVGDVRNKKTGEYYSFLDDIRRTMKKSGLLYYNDITLINNFGTAGLRGRRFFKSRKVVNVKQTCLVFYKGDSRKIKEIFPEVEVKYLDESGDF